MNPFCFRHWRVIGLLFILLPLATATFSVPSEMPVANAFQWSAQLSSGRYLPGDTIALTVRLNIADHHYVYKKRTYVELSGEKLTFASFNYTDPQMIYDSILEEKEEIYRDSMIARAQCVVEKGANEKILLVAVCHYQGCTEKMCLMPSADTLRLALLPVGSEADSFAETLPKNGQQNSLAARIGLGGFLALVFAFLGGLLTCLTPCVYPLIPVTIGIFGAGNTRSRPTAFFLSLTYVSGIAVMFSTLGYIAASTGAVLGNLLANPLVTGAIAFLFFLFGLSLFGAFDLTLPVSLQTRLSSVGGLGFRKAFLMGLVAGIIAAPCTGPSLGAILTYVAASGNRLTGIMMLLSFSLGLGLPFLFLGTFSGMLTARPKPGLWMDGVKSVLGIGMFTMALYFLKDGFQIIRTTVSIISTNLPLSTFLALIGLLMGAIHKPYGGASIAGKVRKIVGVILVVGGAIALIGHFTVLPKTQLKQSSTIVWQSDLEQGLSAAQKQGQPVFVDYTADWCLVCKELDRFTFSDSLVQRELDRFLCIKIDLSKKSKENTRIVEEQKIMGLPTLDFFSSSGEFLEKERILGFLDADAFLNHIRRVK